MTKLIAVPYIIKERCWGCVGYRAECPRTTPAGGLLTCLTKRGEHISVFIEDTDEAKAKYIADKLTGEPDDTGKL